MTSGNVVPRLLSLSMLASCVVSRFASSSFTFAAADASGSRDARSADDAFRSPITELASAMAATSNNAAAAGNTQRRLGAAGAITLPLPAIGGNSSSAASISPADWKRFDESFSRQRMTMCDNASGMSGIVRCGASGTRVSCAASVACGDAPLNGDLPVSNSYASNPTAYTSTR